MAVTGIKVLEKNPQMTKRSDSRQASEIVAFQHRSQ